MNGAEIAMRVRILDAAGRWCALILYLLLLSLPLQSFAQELFWSIERDGRTVGHLLGTIHSEDPQVLDFSEGFLGKLNGSRVFAMELVPDLPTLATLATRMRLPEGESLESVAGARRFAATAAALSSYGVAEEQVRTMQPWAALMTLSVPPPKTGLFMDFSLSLRASGAGVEVVGLETLDQQLAFLEGMRLEDQLSLLDHAILESGHVVQVHDDMISLYLKNDLGLLYGQAMEQLQGVPESARRAFVEQGINARNGNMLNAALPLLAKGDAFIAVGALHLPGESGLLNLLRQKGYELRPAGWPFNAP